MILDDHGANKRRAGDLLWPAFMLGWFSAFTLWTLFGSTWWAPAFFGALTIWNVIVLRRRWRRI